MIRKYKLTGYILLLVAAILTGFIVGVNYGVNNTMRMEKEFVSNFNIHTIKYIRQNKLDKAVELQLSMLDTNLEIIDEIDKNGGKIFYYPQRGISYMRMLGFNLNNQNPAIKSKYKRLRDEIKQERH